LDLKEEILFSIYIPEAVVLLPPEQYKLLKSHINDHQKLIEFIKNAVYNKLGEHHPDTARKVK